jgi:hypothetical protein
MAATAHSRVKIPRISRNILGLLESMNSMNKFMRRVRDTRQENRFFQFMHFMGNTMVSVTRGIANAISTFTRWLGRIVSNFLNRFGFWGRIGSMFFSATMWVTRTVVRIGSWAVQAAVMATQISAMMWSFMVKMADAAVENHLNALLTGSTYSGYQGFTSVYSQLAADPGAILQRIGEGRLDQASDAYGALALLHVKNKGSTTKVAAAAIIAAGQLIRSWPREQLMPLAQGNLLTALFDEQTLRAMREMTDAELRAMAYKAETIPDLTIKERLSLVFLSSAAEDAGERITFLIESKFQQAGLIETIQTFSGVAVKLVTDFLDSKRVTAIGDWFKKFGEDLESGKIVKQFSDAIDKLEKDWMPFFHEWAQDAEWFSDLAKFLLRLRPDWWKKTDEWWGKVLDLRPWWWKASDRLGWDFIKDFIGISSAEAATLGPGAIGLGGGVVSGGGFSTGGGFGGGFGGGGATGWQPSIRYGRRGGGRGEDVGGGGGGPIVSGGPVRPASSKDEAADDKFSIAPGKGGADFRLTDIMRKTARYLPEGWTVRQTSGYRPGDPRFHGRHMALDITIYDPQGHDIPNYQSGASFRLYEEFALKAREIQKQYYPELTSRFAWGGYYGPGAGGRKIYGTEDIMHYDVGGTRGTAGSFETGLYSQFVHAWHVTPSPIHLLDKPLPPAHARETQKDSVGEVDKKTVKIDNRTDDHDVYWKMAHHVNTLAGI